MPYLSVEQDELYYHVESGDPRKVLVLLHSLGTNHLLWKYQVEKFSREGYTVVVPDTRGHGKSSNRGGVSVDRWVNDLLSLLDHLNIEKAVICGVSMGGVQAMAFALKHPERVRALVLADTFAKIDPDAVDDKIKFTAGVAKAQGMDHYADTYLDNTLSDTTSAKAIRHTLREAIAGISVEAYTSSAESCFRIDVENQLGMIAVPTLVLIGEEDHKTPLVLSQTIADRIPNSELHIVPKGRHLSNVDVPDSFNQFVHIFLTGLYE